MEFLLLLPVVVVAVVVTYFLARRRPPPHDVIVMERAHAREQAMEAQEALEEKVAEVVHLASSHLRAPLAVVMSYQALFEQGAVHDEAIKHVLPVIVRQFQDLENLLNELAATAKAKL